MFPRARSWHVPHVFKYDIPPPDQCVNVVFLQRVSDDEYNQVVENLEEIDEDWVNTLDVPKPPPRSLNAKRWIRDYWPSSDVILEIAEQAKSSERYDEQSYRCLIFVDSGWEAGNCIAARWESEGDDLKLRAVRVPMNIAKTLLSACDANEGHSLASILGNDTFEDTKVDFYVDATGPSEQHVETPKDVYSLPESMPQDLALSKENLVIVSLRKLSQDEIEDVVRKITQQPEADKAAPSIKIYNGDGSYETRSEILKLFDRIYQNSDEMSRSMPLILIDCLYEGEEGEPQMLLATKSESSSLELTPAKTDKVLRLWLDAKEGALEKVMYNTTEYVDIWDVEKVFDLNVHKSFGEGRRLYIMREYWLKPIERMRGCPVFYLQPFTVEQDRIVRSKLRELSAIEEGQDWGAEWIYHGYIFSDEGQKHSLEDFRDLLESCDRFSPSYDRKRPGPYRFYDYPSHFVAVDDKIFEEQPQVWLVSSLDFSLDDVSDELGWIYGLVDAKEVHVDWVNLDIGNMGPEEFIDEPERLWLSDLKETKKEWQEARMAGI